MSEILEDILTTSAMYEDNETLKDILMHYGVKRRSGRYPWGSGEDPYQHEDFFLKRVERLKADGWTETPENIMSEFGMTTGQYRKEKSLAAAELKCYRVNRAKSLQKDGLGPTEIARIMSKDGELISESTVRGWLTENSLANTTKAQQTADFIRKQIEEKGMIDVGAGVEIELGVSRERLNQALKILQDEGYPVWKGGIPQATNPGQQINQMIICPKGTPHKDIYNYDQVNSLRDYTSDDDGATFRKFEYPASISSDRVKMLLYDEVNPLDGELSQTKDGVMQIRRGVADLDLGNSRYAQVRILVDGDKYLKGMAVYADDLPDGIDIIYNSNKHEVAKGYKKIKTEDPNNPFGALIKADGQYHYIDESGVERLGAINKAREENDWEDWGNSLPAQFLSKQNKILAKKQLDLSLANKQAEYEDIMALNNPTIKKHFLKKFADECDSAAVDLKAASLPGQQYHVILPVNTLKENEIYAPNYEDGTKLALIRYPHGGTFEIPILTVNNKNEKARKLIGTDAGDAVCINHNVAEQLSGADFDGDTVMCIPTHDRGGRVKISNREPLPGLVGFDTRERYPEVPGMIYMQDPIHPEKDKTQIEMGKISNLITDMTLLGATDQEMERAVRHSMVVIDAAKHKLNYKQSEVDNDIRGLVEKYQRTVNADGSIHVGGASTLISMAKSDKRVVKRQGQPKINIKGEEWYDPSKPEGAYIYKEADDAYWEKTKVNKRTGEVTKEMVPRTQSSTKMAETDDPYSLISAHKNQMEYIYADYASSLKKMANSARVDYVKTGKIAYSKEAKKTYAKEVKSLDDKLDIALVNAPKERDAQRKADFYVDSEIKNYKERTGKDISKGDEKKMRQQAIVRYRSQTKTLSRRERNIDITDKEWEAIQAGAISENKLNKILANADIDALRKRAMPKETRRVVTDGQIGRMQAMRNSNYTIAQIADALGISSSTVKKYLKEGANGND